MNIPPKYEDVVAKLDAALGCEAALREEIEMAKQVQEATDAIVTMVDGQRDHWIEKCGLLKQRLAVAEQRAGDLETALINVRETLGREYWDQYAGLDETRDILDAALKPAADAGFSSSEFTKKSGKSARAPVGLKKDQIVEVFGGGQTQIARVDKTDWRHVEMWRVKP